MKTIFTFIIVTFLMLQSHSQVCTVIITHMINGNQVQYMGSSPDNPTGWSWFFNGGSPSTSSVQNPTVITYSAVGQHICALSVSGGPNSCSASLSSKTDTVTIVSTEITENNSAANTITIVTGALPQLIIESDITETTQINLLNIQGKKIQTIFSGTINKGTNMFEMNAYNLENGIYIFELTKSSGTITKKFYWNK